MSLLKSNSVQIGQSATATQNFTLSVPSSPDGTIKLARGNSGATTADILTVDASGNVTTTLANGIVTPAKLSQPLTQGTAQNPTSTSVDFSGIPSWAKKITFVYAGLSTSGANGNFPQIQLGTSSGIQTTGYTGYTWLGNANNSVHSNGFLLTAYGYNTNHSLYGHAMITLLLGTTWVFSTMSGNVTGNSASVGGGGVTLSSALTTLRLTTGGGDVFDAGTVNIIYEG